MATASPKKSRTIGATLEVPAGVIVRRPDGTQHTVTDGAYVLDVAGTFEVDGKPVEVTA